MFKEPTLWNHQKQVIALSKKLPDLAVFHETGTGKTCSAIQILRHKFAEVGRLRKTLIISPPITLTNWKREIGVFSKVSTSDVIVLQGSQKKRVADFMKACTEGDSSLSRNRIVVTNYEAMQMETLFALIKQWCPEILVCDEAHRLRNKDSIRAKRVAQIADNCTHRYLLTGSPILNSAMDIFFPYRILDGGKTFGNNFYSFRAKYFTDKNSAFAGKDSYFPDFVANTSTYPELNSKIYSKAHRAVKAQCMDLPPLLRRVDAVELSTEQKKLYRDMKTEFLAWITTEKKEKPVAVVAQLAITKALRLLQITSGFVKAEDGIEYTIKDNPRLAYLKELLAELAPQGKIIVWSCFRHTYGEIAKVCEELNLEYSMIVGGGKDHQEQIDRFVKDPNVKIMIANQQAGGIGINLVQANFAIYYSKSFSLDHDMQSEARNYRGGSEMHDKVTRIDLVAPGTIEEEVTEALASKQRIADILLKWNGDDI